MPQQQSAMCRQRAGCNAGTAKVDGQRAWWKLPRGSWRVSRVLRVLSVCSLANGRVECPNKRGYVQAKGRLQCWNADGERAWWVFKGFKRLKPGKRQA